MKISIYTLILPRLEVFFLEEWIDHHLALGIDEIYIYDNGVNNITDSTPAFNRQKGSYCRSLRRDEVGIKWIKKPNADYNLEYSDDEIYQELDRIASKYDDRVKVVSWKNGIDHNMRHPRQQIIGFKNCVRRYKSDWWLHIDPDEFIVLNQHNSFQQLIDINDIAGCFKFGQRVFSSREKDKPVKNIYNWGYDLFHIKKCLIINDIIHYHIHDLEPKAGSIVNLDFNIGLIHHYRGEPSTMGGICHDSKRHCKFDKIDKGMDKHVYK